MNNFFLQKSQINPPAMPVGISLQGQLAHPDVLTASSVPYSRGSTLRPVKM